MKRIAVRRVIRARIGYFAGIALIAVGIFLAVGIGWGLVAFGLGTSAAFVWLYDVTEPSEQIQTRDEGTWT